MGKKLLLAALFYSTFAWAQDFKAEQDFVAAYRKAFEAKDVERLSSLVDWEGVPEQTRELWRQSRKSHFGFKILTVEINPGALEDFGPFTVEGVTYAVNLSVTHTLKLELEDSSHESKMTVFMPLGRKDGQLLIAMGVPSSK